MILPASHAFLLVLTSIGRLSLLSMEQQAPGKLTVPAVEYPIKLESFL
jgi:hypothetical protein